MTHIAEVDPHHTLTVHDILRAGLRRAVDLTELLAAEATWDSEGGAGEPRPSDGEVG
ncbi:MAG: hypothetical protein JWR37_472 [Mycobacterium sp.]|jgi:hypothetical protein|nr:hypothetical protein [Mycobacterium sp.]